MRRAVWTVAAYGLLLAAALVFLAPVWFMLAGSLKPDHRVLVEAGGLGAFWAAGGDWQNYRDVFERVPFGRYFFNSLWITGAVVLLGLAVNSLAGYALARLAWPGRRLLFTAVLMVLIVPLEAIAVPLFYEVTVLGWRDTYIVQILPFVANAFAIYLFYTFFLGLPRALEDAARVDGAGPWRTFVYVIVPVSRPAYAAVAVLTFLTQWGAYLWPLMVTTSERVRPLPLGIAHFYTLPPLAWGDIFAFGSMMVAPVLGVFLVFQRWFVRGVAAAGIKG